ncbi:histidinol dehydrogenase [Clostridium sp. 'White wine YQ']|uniref:histidinol dehydrogenase n=1 Tax=Clostridium sp. 'White wine YQ' TaxID=3027474 RepID=UPI0023673F33|nr:histidinol dehydrogenase [Clostridium sp. 'White wine YQ']MDD7792959.1 histidinol dehydrogenase [Clostridium sp. 'White wine YQ']
MLRILKYNEENRNKVLEELKNREVKESEEVLKSVNEILNKVKAEGDKALSYFTNLYDGVQLESILVSKDESEEAFLKVEKEFIEALEKAKENIKVFHEKQKLNSWIQTNDSGVFMGQRVIPLERVGVYVPGGTAAYPSSVLMNVIPAKVAGVSSVAMITPPMKDGKVNPYILAAAKIAGVDEIYKVGGAQGIGALAFGTESIKAVDKIVGPGNIYVATAKKLVFGTVDIDMIAGPSEILVIADEKAKKEYVAADMLSQGEHDVLASSILLTTSEKLLNEVCQEMEKQTQNLERKDIIKKSMEKFGIGILCESIEECVKLSNIISPEHLELMIENPMELLGKVKNAGSVFLGYYTPEPVGDYFGGPNHVLPTSGTARFFSALSTDSFIKKSSFIYYTREELIKASKDIITLADKEGLTAHGNSIKVRLD